MDDDDTDSDDSGDDDAPHNPNATNTAGAAVTDVSDAPPTGSSRVPTPPAGAAAPSPTTAATSPAVSPRPQPPNQFTEGSILSSPLGQLTAKPPRGVNDSTMQRQREFVTSKIMPLEFSQLLASYPKFSDAVRTSMKGDFKSLESSWGLRYRTGQQKRFAELRDLMVNCALHKLFDA